MTPHLITQEQVSLHAEEGLESKIQISGKHSISAVAIFTFLGYNFLLKKQRRK
jgi:hypothetical protein